MRFAVGNGKTYAAVYRNDHKIPSVILAADLCVFYAFSLCNVSIV